MSTSSQKPIQISESVQDSQPALTLKTWAEEEWQRGRRMECQLFGEKLPTERIEQELPTAAASVDAAAKDPSVLPELLYTYDLCIRVATDSLAEYERHLSVPEFQTKRAMYASHIDSLLGMRELVSGDREYLLAMTSKGAERSQH